MINELTNKCISNMPTVGTTVNQNGAKNIHIDKVAAMQVHNTMVFPIYQQQRPTNVAIGQYGTSQEYYNLFVIGGETFVDWQAGHFIVPKDRALTENMSKDIKDDVFSLSPEAIELIKTFPAIFASENTVYGTSDDTQVAYYGFVTGLSVQDNGIKIYYQPINCLSQKRLNEIIFNLGIKGNNKYNEFSRTHWTIKRINLVEELRSAGMPVMAY
ncbi:hypothetical protein [Clostridium grantii]|uniref:Uncharacterized protein n=1 Tax=Clostridium grantii DSM 8605 TaxID=1121316 RepID=A0A1M5U6P8_9CLOT|nr:hypothetical protein [Clostridium grantii]SHH58608.1 hypothetical protein SAMN02745207_01608 [Clostridium grantii DSM 8605]